jgi:hypothetical protein
MNVQNEGTMLMAKMEEWRIVRSRAGEIVGRNGLHSKTI